MRSPKSLTVTSPLHATARPPARSMRAMVSRAGASSRSFTTTAAPSRASRSATCCPMPRPDPVTIATLPSSSPMPSRLLARIAADHTRSARPWSSIAALGRIPGHEHPRAGPLSRRRGRGDRGPDAADVALPGRDARGARYLFARREWEHWTSDAEDGTKRILADSVAPVLDAGLAELVEMDHRVADGIWLEPTPGHTPGHVSVRVHSDGADAVITGDLMHHPVQVAEPAWQSAFDTDPAQARETRRAFCARYADRPVDVLGTHFHHPTAGRIVRHRDAWRFAVGEPRT